MAKKDNTEAEAPKEPKAPKPPRYPNVPAAYLAESGNYRPGYDAKHASDVAKAILAGGDEQDLLRTLGTDTLREKAIKQVATAQGKFGTQGTEGFVLINGVEYAARKVRGGPVRVDGEDGWEQHTSGAVFDSFESKADREKGKAEAASAGMAETE